jgi:hypothetical protein
MNYSGLQLRATWERKAHLPAVVAKKVFNLIAAIHKPL